MGLRLSETYVSGARVSAGEGMNGYCFANYKSRITLIEYVLAVVLFALSIEPTSKREMLTSATSSCFITAFFGTIFISWDSVLKLLHLLAQYSELERYNIDFSTAFYQTFEINMGAIVYNSICIVLFLILVIVQGGKILDYIWNFNPQSFLPCILLAWLLFRMTNFGDLVHPAASFVNSMKGLDYGTGMAYSYYYGYLRIVLPSTGTANKGLIEKIENIEDAHNLTFATQKLLILIPSSSYIPPDLKDVSYQWMESAVNLEEEQRDRAGVKRRLYRNNVYKIYPGGRKAGSKPIYVVAEGATPLLTFYEVQKHAHPETGIYKAHHKEIVQTFYNKLKELLHNDPDCRDICELIYYEDRNSNGTKVNVAEIILQRLSEIDGTG